MKATVTVREYARLTTDLVASPSLDRAQISPSAFNWLCRANDSVGGGGAVLVKVDDRRSLRLDNYVGVLETPCGTRIEILSKIFDSESSEVASRALLRRMICAAMDIKRREVGETNLQTFDAPLSEWVIGQFLGELSHLVKRGVRFEYARVEASERYLRGQLHVAQQLRRPAGRQHEFQIRHDVFEPDRPENRLLRSALDQVASIAQMPENWRMALELRTLFRDVPSSKSVDGDFRSWRTDRLMAHYRPVRPWCELILYRSMPFSLLGQWHGVSMLFPMEKLFERFVAAWLKRVAAPNVKVHIQAASEYMCLHQGARMFRLEPDVVLEDASGRWVLDTKWKRVDASDRSNKYGLSQSDVYQLFAYGMKYLGAAGGDLILVYPRSGTFQRPLSNFDLGNGLLLHVLPFDLANEELIGFEQASLPLLVCQSVD